MYCTAVLSASLVSAYISFCQLSYSQRVKKAVRGNLSSHLLTCIDILCMRLLSGVACLQGRQIFGKRVAHGGKSLKLGLSFEEKSPARIMLGGYMDEAGGVSMTGTWCGVALRAEVTMARAPKKLWFARSTCPPSLINVPLSHSFDSVQRSENASVPAIQHFKSTVPRLHSSAPQHPRKNTLPQHRETLNCVTSNRDITVSYAYPLKILR